MLPVRIRSSLLATATVAALAAATAGATSEIQVDGRLISINGQTEVPRGLFGVHAYGINEQNVERYGIECIRQIQFIPGAGVRAIGKDGKVKPLYRKLAVAIDCMGDRYHTATVLSNKNYEEFFTRIGREYAQRCKDADYEGHVEFWNEPYLNWAERSRGSGRNNYHPKWYEVDKATDNGPVTIKGWDKPVRYLRWRRYWPANAKGNVVPGIEVPGGLKPGDTFKATRPAGWYFLPAGEQTFTVKEEWHPIDPTAKHFWSGKQNLDYYMWMFMPWAKAVKETNPQVTVIGGWDFGLSHGDWDVWKTLTVPLIDEGIDYLDGIAEHHYGIDTRYVTTWYEVINAYSVTKHNKWLRGYNTECGGYSDPAWHRESTGAKSGLGAATYLLRDVIELIYHSPAKSGSRTAHHPKQDGELLALAFLKPLRGKLVRTWTTDPDLWPVASIHGGNLVIVVFNNATEARPVKMRITAPGGAGMKEGQIAWLTPGKIHAEAAKVSGATATIDREIGPREAIRWTFPLTKEIAVRPQIARHQFFAPRQLVAVDPGKAVTLSIPIDRAKLAATEAARLKLTLEKVKGDEVSVTLNGTTIDLPDRQWTFTVPIDKSLLREKNTLTFTVADSGDGYPVDVASIEIDTAAED